MERFYTVKTKNKDVDIWRMDLLANLFCRLFTLDNKGLRVKYEDSDSFTLTSQRGGENNIIF